MKIINNLTVDSISSILDNSYLVTARSEYIPAFYLNLNYNNIEFIPQAKDIQNKFESYPKNIKSIIESLVILSDYNLNISSDIIKLKNFFNSLDGNSIVALLKVIPDYRDQVVVISRATTVNNYKTFLGYACSNISTGQKITIHSKIHEDQLYYSNFFFIAKILSNNILKPLITLVIKKENVQEALFQLLVSGEVDNKLLEFWVDAEFSNSNNALSILYKKIMLPEIRKNNINIVIKKDILTEFRKVYKRPKFPTLKDLTTYDSNLVGEFLEFMRNKYGIKEYKISVPVEKEKPSELYSFLGEIEENLNELSDPGENVEEVFEQTDSTLTSEELADLNDIRDTGMIEISTPLVFSNGEPIRVVSQPEQDSARRLIMSSTSNSIDNNPF